MGADISVESVAGKLNRVGYEAFIQALRQAKNSGNRNIELGHWMFQLIQKDRTDLALTADHFNLNRSKLLADATAAVNGFRKNETEMPGISNQVADALDRGWHYATLLFGETQIRTGHLLVAILKSLELRRALIGVSQEFSKIPADELRRDGIDSWVAADRDPAVRASLDLPHWPHSARPDNLILLVAGGGHPTNSYWMEGYSPHVVGREIKLPKGFSKLLEQTERDIGCGAEACRI